MLGYILHHTLWRWRTRWFTVTWPLVCCRYGQGELSGQDWQKKWNVPWPLHHVLKNYLCHQYRESIQDENLQGVLKQAQKNIDQLPGAIFILNSCEFKYRKCFNFILLLWRRTCWSARISVVSFRNCCVYYTVKMLFPTERKCNVGTVRNLVDSEVAARWGSKYVNVLHMHARISYSVSRQPYPDKKSI